MRHRRKKWERVHGWVEGHLPGWHTVYTATAPSHYGPPPPAYRPQKASAGPVLGTQEWEEVSRRLWGQKSQGRSEADLEGCSSGSCGQQQHPHGSGNLALLSARIQAPGPYLPGGTIGEFREAQADTHPQPTCGPHLEDLLQ
jgi:hypothetical protein